MFSSTLNCIAHAVQEALNHERWSCFDNKMPCHTNPISLIQETKHVRRFDVLVYAPGGHMPQTQRHFDAKTTWWRRFGVIMTLLLRRVPARCRCYVMWLWGENFNFDWPCPIFRTIQGTHTPVAVYHVNIMRLGNTCTCWELVHHQLR